ncbi:MAG: SpoIIE family protein phosphatase [Proteobacteria bacterium]|nr:SpoIIE family protein phosphatase [Pseudomonadota bacterium]
MGNLLPDYVNKKRRKTLTIYSILALLVYHIPAGWVSLAKYWDIISFPVEPIVNIYISVIVFYVILFVIIRVKKQITLRFINTLLYLQIIFSIINLTVFFYVMQDLRFLTLFTCLLAMTFVFVQSPLTISFIVIAFVTVDYLIMSYVGIFIAGQPGDYKNELLLIFNFLPASAFIAIMCNTIRKQHTQIRLSRDEMKNTHLELETTHATLQSFNDHMMDSIHYAEMIQRSLLPGLDRMKTISPDSLFIWIPKDIVGGDIFYTYTLPEKTVIALMDCTGHGVPGAFLTMIAYTEIRKIILDEECHSPAEILKRLNRSMKHALQNVSGKKIVDDGLDAAVVEVNHDKKTICYAGARIPLFYIEHGQITVIQGDKQSIGYMDSDENFIFTNHTVEVSNDCCIYLKTDGLTDQLGGKKRLRFGNRRFKEVIQVIYQSPFSVQRQEILHALRDYQGSEGQMDDITAIGFKV